MNAIDMMPFSFSAGVNLIWNFLPVWFGICILWSVLKYVLKGVKSHRDYSRDEAESIFAYKKMGYALKADLEKSSKNISIADINDLECQLESTSSKMHRAIFGAWSARMNAKQIREGEYSSEQEIPVSDEDKIVAYRLLSEAVSKNLVPANQFFSLKKRIESAKTSQEVAKLLEKEGIV